MTDLFLCLSTCASDPARLRIAPATPLYGAATPRRAAFPCLNSEKNRYFVVCM